MRRALLATALAVLVASPPAAAAQRAFYVAPSGNDRNRGTEAAPFRTLERARTAVRKAAPKMRGTLVVYLRGGTHVLRRPLVLDYRDSGRNGFRVVWRGFPGETAVISGGRRIKDWRALPGGLWRAPTPGLATRQLYVNGERAVRARGEIPIAAKTASGYAAEIDLSTWRNPRDIELVFNSVWTQQRGLVDAIDGRLIHMRQPWFANAQLHPPIAVGLPVRAENAFELLDEPAEWYLDRGEGALYYRPRAGEDPARAEIVAPVLERLIDGRGTLRRPLHDVAFEQLTFAHATWFGVEREGGHAPFVQNFAFIGRNTSFDGGGDKLAKMPANVSFRAARRVSFAGNRFVHLGGAGLGFEHGSRDDTITGNEFTDISGSAIQLGDVHDHHPADPRVTVAGLAVVRNRIHDVAVEFQGGNGVWAGFVVRTRIEHNDLRDLPYSAISLGWGWGVLDWPGKPTVARDNRIVGNRIERYMRVLEDGGGVYVPGSQPGLLVRRNVVLDQLHRGGGLYLDDNARSITVEENVVWLTRGWPFFFKGGDHVIRNNWWDNDFPYCWSWFTGGVVEGNRLIRSLDEVPREVLAEAGLGG